MVYKAQISTTQLTSFQKLAKKIISKSMVVPILEQILVQKKGNQTFLVVTDLQNYIKKEISCSWDADFGDKEFLLPNKFSPKAFSGDTVEVSFGEARVTMAGQTFGIDQTSKDFPKTGEVTKPLATINTDSSYIKPMMQFCSTDELRLAMTGVYFDYNEMKIASTDGHRLSTCAITSSEDLKGGFIVPKKAMNILPLRGPIKIEHDEVNTQFTTNEYTIVTRNIDENYPNYTHILSDASFYRTLSVKDISSFINKVEALLVNTSTHQIRFDLTNKELKVSGEDLDYQDRAEFVLNECTFTGESISIGVNRKFFLEIVKFLKKMGVEQFELNMSEPNKAMTINCGPYTFLVMPVMLNNYI